MALKHERIRFPGSEWAFDILHIPVIEYEYVRISVLGRWL